MFRERESRGGKKLVDAKAEKGGATRDGIARSTRGYRAIPPYDPQTTNNQGGKKIK